jgi:hypothetical protein
VGGLWTINRGRKCFGMPKDSESVSVVGAAEVFCELLILLKTLEPYRGFAVDRGIL